MVRAKEPLGPKNVVYFRLSDKAIKEMNVTIFYYDQYVHTLRIFMKKVLAPVTEKGKIILVHIGYASTCHLSQSLHGKTLRMEFGQNMVLTNQNY